MAGVSTKAIEVRLRRGDLLRIHRGVYRVGHRAPSVAATYMAAVLACGSGAVLSGRAAGFLHGLIKGSAPEPEVTVAWTRKIPGFTVRRAPLLDPRDKGVARSIPVTRVSRTLVDLASLLTQPRLARAVHEAGVLHGVGALEIEVALARHSRTRGAATLRGILRGDTNVTASGRTVDCRWPSRNLTVELDGFKFHSSRHAWERDQARAREAYARGDEFRRFTYADVTAHPAAMLRELRAFLEA